MVTAERFEDMTLGRLHPQADPIHPGIDEGCDEVIVDVVGVALDGHLRAGNGRNRADDRSELLRRNQ